MKNSINLGITILLMIAFFNIGCTIKAPGSSYSEIKSLQEKNLNPQQQNFHYTHIYGQNYNFSVQQYKYPLDDEAKCFLLNEALKLTPDTWTCNCDILKLHESNWYLNCGIGCVGFNIDEKKNNITSMTTCITN